MARCAADWGLCGGVQFEIEPLQSASSRVHRASLRCAAAVACARTLCSPSLTVVCTAPHCPTCSTVQPSERRARCVVRSLPSSCLRPARWLSRGDWPGATIAERRSMNAVLAASDVAPTSSTAGLLCSFRSIASAPWRLMQSSSSSRRQRLRVPLVFATQRQRQRTRLQHLVPCQTMRMRHPMLDSLPHECWTEEREPRMHSTEQSQRGENERSRCELRAQHTARIDAGHSERSVDDELTTTDCAETDPTVLVLCAVSDPR